MGLLVNVVDVFVDDNGDHGNPLAIVWASPATRRREQDIAADLGFSETIFIDDVTGPSATARIFTPARQLPFAGHPTVGLAAWFHQGGNDIREINVPAGSVRVRTDGERAFVTAHAEWSPPFEITRFDSREEVGAVDPDAYGQGLHYIWAYTDEAAGHVRARMFAPDLGIREDEATGSAAIRLTSELARDLTIVQGRGSVIHTHSRYLGQQVEVGGRVGDARIIEQR